MCPRRGLPLLPAWACADCGAGRLLCLRSVTSATIAGRRCVGLSQRGTATACAATADVLAPALARSHLDISPSSVVACAEGSAVAGLQCGGQRSSGSVVSRISEQRSAHHHHHTVTAAAAGGAAATPQPSTTSSRPATCHPHPHAHPPSPSSPHCTPSLSCSPSQPSFHLPHSPSILSLLPFPTSDTVAPSAPPPLPPRRPPSSPSPPRRYASPSCLLFPVLPLAVLALPSAADVCGAVAAAVATAVRGGGEPLHGLAGRVRPA